MGDRLKIDPAYRQRLSDAGLDSVDRVISEKLRVQAADGRTAIRVDLDAPPGQPGLSIKAFVYPDWPTRFNFLGRCLFGRSRAVREWRRLRRMRRLGLQSTRPLALGERRRLGFLTCCFLVTEGVPASDSLRDFACRYFHKAASPRGRELKRALMDELADQIRIMHDKRFYHGELTWDDILIRPTPVGHFEFFFVNALRGRRVWLPPNRRRWAARDLAGIDAVPNEFLSRGDKIRFMKRYLKTKELSADDRAWMEQIQAASRLMFASRSTYRSARPADPPPSSSPQVQPRVST